VKEEVGFEVEILGERMLERVFRDVDSPATIGDGGSWSRLALLSSLLPIEVRVPTLSASWPSGDLITA